MKPPRVLSQSISSCLLLGGLSVSPLAAKAAVYTWDGGGGDTNLSNPLNWSADIIPDVSLNDTALWDGTVAGPLSLLYGDAAFAGVAGNTGIDLSMAATQTGSLNIDTGANTNSLRMNNLSIAAGAGAFSLGDGAGAFNITLGGAGGQTHTWTNSSTSTATIGSDVVIGLGGAGAHNLALGGTGNWTFNNAIGQGNGTLTIIKSGSGTLTLTGNSTYTGGLIHNAGTLLVNNAGALGNTAVGSLTINGGTIDNTSGAAITTTTAKAQNWNGDFTFAGTNNLSFNGGAVTLGGSGNNRTVNIGAGTLTVGNLIGTGYGLTKTGAGTLAIGSGTVSRITGVLNIAGGKVQIAQGTTTGTANDLFVGGLAGSGTIETGNTVSRWLFVQNTADSVFSGTLQNGGAALGLSKAGTGTQTLTGTNSYTSQTSMLGGTLEFGSATTAGITQTLSTAANTGLVFDRADSTVKSSFNGTGTASLTFGSRVIRTAGAAGNFVISGGINGVDNRINLTQAAGFINQGLFFNGDNYAFMDAANTFVRGMVYGTDAGAVTSGAATSLASATHQEFTGSVSAQDTATFTTLKDNGNNAFTLNAGATVTVNGILKSGNVAGGATISGGAGIQAANNAELVIRTNGINDALTISTPILANGTSSLTTSGAGTLTLAGVNTYTGVTTVNSTMNLTGSIATGAVNITGGGTLNLNAGAVINPANGDNGQFNVGSSAGGNAILNINGGTLNAGRNANPSFAVGGSGGAGTGGNANNVSGFVKMTSGALTTRHELHIGNGNGAVGSNAYAAFSLTGGNVTSGNWLVVGLANGDRAVLNQSGGSIAVNANRMTIGAGGNTSLGIVNQSGGTLTVAAGGNTGIFLGENGFANYTLSGDGQLVLNTDGTANSGTMQFAGNGSSLGANFNLNGGTLTTFGVTKGASTATGIYRFNFNGGTLKANGNNAAFLADLANTEAYIFSGGGTIDTNGKNVTVSEPLRAPVGSGLTSIAVQSGGSGYIDTPVVTITGGTGTGATAVANVSGGVVTGFTITSPGTGYSPGDVLNVNLFGGGATNYATVGAVNVGAITGGGLTKSGAGTLTLNSVNTYTGPTTITGGELRLVDPGSINGSSGITINGAGAKLVQNGLTQVAAPVVVANGTLDGTGFLTAVTVNDAASSVITHGDGTGSTLTIDSLTFNGAATLNLAASLSAPALSTLNLTTGATNSSGKVTINATNPSGSWSLGSYNLISYNSLGGQGFGGFVKGTVPNLGARQAAALTNSAGFIALTISGDLPVWTGAQNGSWTTNTIGGASNWKLQSGGTPTDFIAGDTVLFDDTVTGTTTVDISTANVAPTSTTFDNTLRDYVISSSGGFGIASGNLVKNGAGRVTLTTANIYSGGTVLNNGTLTLNHPSAIGTGTLLINGGALDNTSGATLTLSTNNAQTWNGDFGFSGSLDLNVGTGAVSLTGNRIVTTSGTGKLTVGGVIGGAGFGITKAGAGEMVLAGANSYTGATNVSGGTLTVTGSINGPNAANIGQITVGSEFDNAVMRIAGGSVFATKTAAPSIVAGNSSGSTGALFVDSGSLTAANELWVGAPAGAFGGMTINGGTVSVGSWLAVGRNGTGILDVNGGSLTVTGQNFTLGSFLGATSAVTLKGGTTTTTNTAANQGIFIVGENGDGVLTVSGSAVLNVSGALGVQVARGGTGRGFVNLNGGTITTPAVTKGTGPTGIFNFNGGTLRPTAANPAFMTGLSAAYVFPGGANIDTNGQNISIAQPLVAPSGLGVTSIAVSDGGSGYIHAPLVRISGGTGTGATAVANIVGGAVTSVTITNPGTGYTAGDFLNVSFEGGTTTPAIPGNIVFGANASTGGLNKVGNGTLTLSGANTYGGATNITAGTLLLDVGGSINGTTGITINGAGARLVQANPAVPIVPTVTVTNGSLDGTGIVNSVVVGNGTGGVITNGNGGTGALTIGTLTFNGAGAVNVSTAGSIGLAVTGALTTNGPGTVALNVPVGIPWATGTTYNLISFGTLNGTIDNFTIGNIAGLGARQTPSPVVSGNNISIIINGDTPVWTGADSGVWSTTPVGGLSNWKLQIAGTNTEFLTNDQVIFDDTATGTTAITINDATAAPASVTFNNSTKNYTVAGAFGITSGLLVKNGTGSVTISTANTYTGGTTVNAGTLTFTANNNFGAGFFNVTGGVVTLSGSNTLTGPTTLGNNGTLNINNATALGTSVITINGGTINNTSPAAITLTNANALNWNGDFTFTGTNSLNFNNGAVAIGGAPGQRVVNINGGTLSTGVFTSAAGVGLTKTGAGTLAMTSTANTSVIQGLLDVQSGTLQTAGDLTINGGLSGAGTIENGGAASKWLYLTNPNDTTFSGTIRDNPNNAAVRLGLVKRGAGTLNLTGAENTTTDRFAVEDGGVRVTGTYTAGNGTGADQTVLIGNVANQTGTLTVDGGTFNANRTAAPSLSAGTVANSQGVIKLTSGTINSANELWIGTAVNAYGALIMSGGTINSGNWLPVGRTGTGVAEISGGTINVTAQNYTMGSFAGGNGVTNLSGGAINVTSTTPNEGGFIVGEAANGTLNISGSGSLTISGSRGLHLATTSGTGYANLNGGVVTTPIVQKGGGTGGLNFDGGTLKATTNAPTFLQGLSSAYINDGGAIIDDGGFNITVDQPLLAPTGSGVSSFVTTGGTGYVGAPVVQISGDGFGATAVAKIDASGNLTGITVTNPGVDYTSATATLIGGGGNATVDLVNLATNTSGGLAKKGAGKVTLSGANTYTGATTIEAGTLAVTGSISGSNTLHVKSGATLDVSGVAAGFALENGQTLKGSGNVSGATTLNAGARIAPGDSVGTLTFNGNLDLTLAVTPLGSGTLNFELAAAGASDLLALTSGSLSIGTGVLGFDDFVFSTLPGLNDGTYTLIDGSAAINGTLDLANLTGSLGLGFTGTLGLANNGSDIVLVVVPEPGSATMLVTAVSSILGLSRFRRRSSGGRS